MLETLVNIVCDIFKIKRNRVTHELCLLDVFDQYITTKKNQNYARTNVSNTSLYLNNDSGWLTINGSFQVFNKKNQLIVDGNVIGIVDKKTALVFKNLHIRQINIDVFVKYEYIRYPVIILRECIISKEFYIKNSDNKIIFENCVVV